MRDLNREDSLEGVRVGDRLEMIEAGGVGVIIGVIAVSRIGIGAVVVVGISNGCRDGRHRRVRRIMQLNSGRGSLLFMDRFPLLYLHLALRNYFYLVMLGEFNALLILRRLLELIVVLEELQG